jgi:phosphate transport system substrate-binding protein
MLLWLNKMLAKKSALTAVIYYLPALLMLNCVNKRNGSSGTVIQVKGSDTMVNIAQAWAEQYKTIVPSVEIEVSGGGSGVGISALLKGAIDIANASRNIKKGEAEMAEKNTGKKPFEIIAGYDALAVFVHKNNPLNNISVEQLSQIFVEDGQITRWSQLGITIPGVKDDRIIRISRQSSSGTYEFFRKKILLDRDFKLGSCDMNGSKEVVELVAATKTAIGYSGMGYASHGVKMLSIAVEQDGVAVAPTVENTLNHTYILARSLLMYTLGKPTGAAAGYILWILSAQGQKIVEENGYVPVPFDSAFAESIKKL